MRRRLRKSVSLCKIIHEYIKKTWIWLRHSTKFPTVKFCWQILISILTNLLNNRPAFAWEETPGCQVECEAGKYICLVEFEATSRRTDLLSLFRPASSQTTCRRIIVLERSVGKHYRSCTRSDWGDVVVHARTWVCRSAAGSWRIFVRFTLKPVEVAQSHFNTESGS